MGNGDQISSTGGMFIDIDSNNDSTAATLNLTRDGKTKTTASFSENGDISFYEDTGTTPKLFWDASAESLGIGTSRLRQGLWAVKYFMYKTLVAPPPFE